MKASELQKLLNSIPPHIDVVIGDLDTGIFSEPSVHAGRLITLWKLVQENPAGSPHFITYFESKVAGEAEQLNSSLLSLAFHEVECTRL